MSTISQRKALLLAAIVPAMLVTGCAAGGAGTQAKGAASPTDMMSPDMTDTGMESPPTETEGVGGAQTTVQQYLDAIKAGALDRVMSAFADDAVVEVEGQPTAKGTDAIRKLFEDRLKEPNGMKQATHTVEEAQAVGEAAVVRTTSKQGADTMRGLFLLSQDGGEWKIAYLMSNKGA
jgi:uncharacterized protein (TIGR02246 family)